jgi:hypothetical protein
LIHQLNHEIVSTVEDMNVSEEVALLNLIALKADEKYKL